MTRRGWVAGVLRLVLGVLLVWIVLAVVVPTPDPFVVALLTAVVVLAFLATPAVRRWVWTGRRSTG
jgi:hypothetical protein